MDRKPTVAKRAVALLLLAALTLSGCYRAVPLAGEPQPGTRVLITFTDRGRGALHDVIGTDAVQVEGETAEVTPDQWRLLMLTSWHLRGRETPWHRESVSVPVAYFAKVEQRELDRKRTALLVGALTGAAVLLGRGFVKGWGSDPDNGGQSPGH